VPVRDPPPAHADFDPEDAFAERDGEDHASSDGDGAEDDGQAARAHYVDVGCVFTPSVCHKPCADQPTLPLHFLSPIDC
jgi:hypothetical protein